MSTDEKTLERSLRRKLYAAGYILHKSRVRNINIDNLGGYMVVWMKYNAVVAGDRFQLDLDDVASFAADI